MTPEQINIAIAEALGWTWFSWGTPPGETNRFIASPSAPLAGSMIPCARPSHGLPVNIGDVPDYHGSLDAMHEAHETLTHEEHRRYVNELQLIVYRGGFDKGNKHRSVNHATAAQRAEAFLRTVGKWQEPSA